MKKNKTPKEIENTNESSSKRSIMLRWAFANTVFCFITFTVFAVVIYQATVRAIINGEKNVVLNSMTNIENVLSEAKEPLTSEILHQYIEYTATIKPGNHSAEEQTLMSMIGSQKAFYIYDIDKHLLYSTHPRSFGFMNLKNNEIKQVDGKNPGFLVEREIVSKSTGEVIGYLQAFYDLTSYHKVRNLLLISLLVLEVVALIVAQIIGYFMAHYFMRPLEKLHKGMQEVAEDPTGEFKPIEIKTGDEIEELAHVYNEMMMKTNAYVEQQKRFVSDVSHELRTPLAVLDGHINLLNRWGKNDAEILDESLQASQFEISRMKKMLEEMLALARLENVDLSSSELDCDVVKVCKHAVKNFALVRQEFEIELIQKVSDETRAKIYPNHYEQALSILLDNAAKYSPDDRKSITITIAEDEDYVITKVSDKGIGISKEDIQHLFERFFRADKARNRDIGGTGLGLSIMARLAENYKGKIEVESELGVGSTFILKIPKLD